MVAGVELAELGDVTSTAAHAPLEVRGRPLAQQQLQKAQLERQISALSQQVGGAATAAGGSAAATGGDEAEELAATSELATEIEARLAELQTAERA